jgi:hypothetical protein
MSSKRRLRKRMCQDKVRYTREAAYEARHRLQMRGEFVNAYKCDWCGGWHVGHPPRRCQEALGVVQRRTP